MINETVLRREEKAEIALRSLYARYGYLPYRMSKFEEYELKTFWSVTRLLPSMILTAGFWH